MALLVEDAIRGGSPGKRKQWETLIFLCTDCSREIVVLNHPSHLKRASGRCRSCAGVASSVSQRKRPFENLYNYFKRQAGYYNKIVSLTFEEFLNFTRVEECHYCSAIMGWKPYGGGGYNLDRKDNALGYTKDNCVVCCGICNNVKGNRFSYEEMLMLGETIRKIREYQVLGRDGVAEQVPAGD